MDTSGAASNVHAHEVQNWRGHQVLIGHDDARDQQGASFDKHGSECYGNSRWISSPSFPAFLPKSDSEIFFWVTAKVKVISLLPSQLNATAWEQDYDLTRLLSRSRE